MIKFILTTFIITLTGIISFSQQYLINFENNDDSLIRIDTANHSNIWQIGKPQKAFFDSAISKPKAIITDTINAYPINNQSSFTLKIFDPSWLFTGSDVILMLNHKYDMDTLKDGGYVDISIDGGNSWNNIANVPDVSQNLYYVNDTILGGITGLSGKSNWISSYLTFCGYAASPPQDKPVFLKFIFKSDSIQTNKEGWMIDNITIQLVVDACGAVHELQEKPHFTTVTPNPLTNESTFEFKNPNDKLIEIDIYNSTGEKKAEYKNILGNKLNLRGSNFSEGFYFYMIKTKNGYSESGKFIVK
jgi:hypothetical protein